MLLFARWWTCCHGMECGSILAGRFAHAVSNGAPLIFIEEVQTLCSVASFADAERVRARLQIACKRSMSDSVKETMTKRMQETGLIVVS